ncbi:MAG: DMT family transporter [Sterolibacterium sp.]|nr:DMT family transporter [Sterolibacterium sp.]
MAMIWMLAASLLFACMGVCVKLAAARFAAAELVFYRGFISLLLIYGYMWLRNMPAATPHWRMHVTRSVAGFAALVMYFLAISMIPLATAVTLNYTSPLFLAVLLAVWQRERIGWPLLLAVMIGFLGVILLLQPSWQAEQMLGGLFGLASGAISSVAYLHVRKLGELGEPEWRTVFWFSLVSTLAGLPWVLSAGSLHGIQGRDGLFLLGIGGFGAIAQLCMTRAYKQGRTLAVANLAYTTVVFSSLFGYALWAESLSLLALGGIALIIASGMLAGALPAARLPQRDSVIVGAEISAGEKST